MSDGGRISGVARPNGLTSAEQQQVGLVVGRSPQSFASALRSHADIQTRSIADREAAGGVSPGHSLRPRPTNGIINSVWIASPETAPRNFPHENLSDTYYFDWDGVVSQLRVLGEKYGFEVHEKPGASNLWLQDQAIVAGLPGREVPGSTGVRGLFLAPSDVTTGTIGKLVSSYQFQGAAGRGGAGPLPNLSDIGRTPILKADSWERFAVDMSWPVKRIRTVLDGGDVSIASLPGRTPGRNELVVCVGEHTVLLNTLLLDSRGELDGGAIQQLVEQSPWPTHEVQAMASAILERHHARSGSGEKVDPLGFFDGQNDDIELKAKELLAKIDLTRKVIAEDLNVSLEQLIVIPRAAFHHDLNLAFGPQGEVFVNDPRMTSDMFRAYEKTIDFNSMTAEERDSYKEFARRSGPDQYGFSPDYIQALDQTAATLEKAGFKVHRVPASFTAHDSVFLNAGRYLNGIMGKSPHDGSTYLITNATTIKFFDQYFAEHMSKLGVTVHFIEGMEEFVNRGQGALGCVTLTS